MAVSAKLITICDESCGICQGYIHYHHYGIIYVDVVTVDINNIAEKMVLRSGRFISGGS